MGYDDASSGSRADRQGDGIRSLPPGFASRVVAVVLAGAVVILLQDNLARRRAADSPVPAADTVARPAEPAPVVAVTATEPEPELGSGARTLPSSTSVAEPADPADPPGAEPPAAEAEPSPTPPAPRVEPGQPPAAVAQAAPAAPAVEERAADGTAAEEAPPAEPPLRATTACWHVAELHEAGENGTAQQEARAVLETFDGPTELTAALIAEGVPTPRARLLTILALHAAGDEEAARELARLTRAGHEGNREVAETLRRWNILRPRITEFTSFVNEDQQLVMRGTVHNDDIGAIRKVKVRGEALDEQGNVIAAIDTRVKPRLIAPDLAGEFEILFKNLSDQEQVTRTRATVVGFEYEVAARH